MGLTMFSVFYLSYFKALFCFQVPVFSQFQFIKKYRSQVNNILLLLIVF